MERNNRRNDENWLAPVTQTMYENFLKDVAGMIYFDNKDKCYNVSGSPYFVAKGVFCKNMEDREGSLYLGEYGPIMLEKIGMLKDRANIGNDFETLFELDKKHPVMKEIYIEWIKLVAKANEGRLINGKGYLATLQKEAHEYIVAKRDNEIQSILGRANNKTVNLVQLLNEVVQYKDDETQI